MAVLSLFLFLISIIFGFRFPKNALWFSIIFLPVLYPANVAIIPSDTLYLNINRIVFGILIGIFVKRKNVFLQASIYKNRVVKYFLIFSVYVIMISLSDRLPQMIITYIPNLIIMIFLGYFVINSENDFIKLIKILSWQSAVFSVIVILDYFHIVNLSLIVRQMSPSFDAAYTQIGGMRGGQYRVAGWDGDSIRSAVRLVNLIFISLLDVEFSKNKIIAIIPVILSFISIILLMSRNAYLSLGISLLFLFYYLFKYVDNNILNKIVSIVPKVTLIVVVLVASIIFVPFVNSTVNNMIEYSEKKDTQKDLDARFDRIPKAIDKFLEKPILGWGSREYSYYVVINSDDIPLPLLYLIAGGVPLFIIYMIWIMIMPFYFLKISKLKIYNKRDKIIAIYVSAAILSSIIPMLGNMVDKSLILIMIIFMATYKYYIIRYKTIMINSVNYS